MTPERWRVLIASDHYPPFIGGAQRQTLLLAHELRSRGHAVHVATVWQDGLPRRQDDDGVEVSRIRQLRTVAAVLRGPARRRHQPPFPDPVSVLELRRVIAGFRPDIVHAAGWFGYSCSAALLGKDVPMLFSARDYGFSCPKTTLVRGDGVCSGPELFKCLACAGGYYGVPRGWIAALGVRAFERLLRRKASGLHSVSAYVDGILARDFLRGEQGVPREVIPSFRVESEGERNTEVLERLPAEPFILFVGALRMVKGLGPLLAAYRQLESPPPLVLLGTVERETPRELPPGVLIIEELPNWAVLRAWDRSMFGAMPSLWPEPFGSVVHEAMSRGRAVIGSTPGGHSDMIEDGKSGLLVPAGDVKALADAMQRLVDDPEMRERLGCHARQRAGAFDAQNVIPRFERFYAQLIGEARGTRPGRLEPPASTVHAVSALADPAQAPSKEGSS